MFPFFIQTLLVFKKVFSLCCHCVFPYFYHTKIIEFDEIHLKEQFKMFNVKIIVLGWRHHSNPLAKLGQLFGYFILLCSAHFRVKSRDNLPKGKSSRNWRFSSKLEYFLPSFSPLSLSPSLIISLDFQLFFFFFFCLKFFRGAFWMKKETISSS